MTTPKKVHGMTGHRNAAKPESDKAAGYLVVRVSRATKAAWVHTAQARGLNLSEWVNEVLNQEAKE
jgi:predicted HicB family RNase H-like nuclease